MYQRGVLHGSQYMYGTWLEEMTAMTMEDALSSQIDPSFNNVRDSRFPAWLQSAYDCSLTAFDPSLSSSCPGYPISGSLGGFLLRQYGIAYYTNLLQNFTSTDSSAVLSNAIQAGGGMHRVHLGPYPNRSAAERVAGRIRQALGYTPTFVTR